MISRPLRASPRIASLQPSVSVTLEHLGRLDSLVACTRYCLEAVPALRGRNLKIVADSWSATTEEIVSAAPNLVVASVPYRLESLAAILKCGCPILTLSPHSLNDIYQDIRLLGDLVQAGDRAEAVIAEMLSAIEAVGNRASQALRQASSLPVVYCEEWGKPLIHSQAWVSELVSAAGGCFLGTPGSVTNAETIAAADPEVLVFAWCGAGARVPLARVIQQRAWQLLRAVRNGRVYCIPDEFLNTPAPGLVEGLRALACAIHPEIFGTTPCVRVLG